MKKNRLLAFAKWINSTLGSTITCCVLFTIILLIIFFSVFHPCPIIYPEEEYQELYNAATSCIDIENKQIKISKSNDGITFNVLTTTDEKFIITAKKSLEINPSIDVKITLSSDFEIISQTRNFYDVTAILVEIFFKSVIASLILTTITFFFIVFPFYVYMEKHKKKRKNYLPYHLAQEDDDV